MIIARLNGGLGNQMFIYAAAYAFAKDTGDSLSVYKFEYDTINRAFNYQLDRLAIEDCSTYWGIPMQLYLYTCRCCVDKILSKVCHRSFEVPSLRIKRINYVKEAENAFRYPDDIKPNNFNLLDGFWQSPLYFDRYRDDILLQFRPKFKLSNESREYERRILSSSSSVSLHIRRGDYVGINWCLPLEYYYKAMNIADKIFKDPVFYIFSDDIEWVKTNLDIERRKAIYVTRTSRVEAFEDLWLMTKCKGNIIANSSFSWWGAYLNENKEKFVVAPSKMRETNNHDFALDDWIVI